MLYVHFSPFDLFFTPSDCFIQIAATLLISQRPAQLSSLRLTAAPYAPATLHFFVVEVTESLTTTGRVRHSTVGKLALVQVQGNTSS